MSRSSRQGLRLTALILLGWLASLAAALLLPSAQLSWPLLLALVLMRTQLQTGLFIVGHDAMHGVLLPERPRSNDRLGALALALYAALPYQRCRRNHQRHHRFTASAADPDFHPEPGAGPLAWYGRFMAGYLTPGQMGRLLGSWALLALLAGGLRPSGGLAVLLFCTLPLLLSSLQLFLFGTYLPHRRQRAPQARPDPDSLAWPAWLSLLACFHFGYHREHHDRPDLPWFALARAGRAPRLASPAGSA